MHIEMEKNIFFSSSFHKIPKKKKNFKQNTENLFLKVILI